MTDVKDVEASEFAVDVLDRVDEQLIEQLADQARAEGLR